MDPSKNSISQKSITLHVSLDTGTPQNLDLSSRQDKGSENRFLKLAGKLEAPIKENMMNQRVLTESLLKTNRHILYEELLMKQS